MVILKLAVVGAGNQTNSLLSFFCCYCLIGGEGAIRH